MKQGQENAQFIKEREEGTTSSIFQKNSKTKVGAWVIVTFLIL